MSDQSEENPEPIGVFKKITAFWNSLNNSLKAILGVITTLTALIVGIYEFWDKIFPPLPDDLKKEILKLDENVNSEVLDVLAQCEDYGLVCLPYVLETGAQMSDIERMNEVVSWIKDYEENEDRDDIFEKCQQEARSFLLKMKNFNRMEQVTQGLTFYEKLLLKFKDNYPDEVNELAQEFIQSINESSDSLMNKRAKNRWVNSFQNGFL